MDSVFFMLFLTKHESNLIVHGYCPLPSIITEDLIGNVAKILWRQKVFLNLWGIDLSMRLVKLYGSSNIGVIKIYGGVIFNTTL